MCGSVRTFAAIGVVLTLFAPVSAQPLLKARAAAVDAEKALAEADVAEKAGKYEKALELYLKAYTAGRTDPSIRDHIRTCFRNVSQGERHRDPAFRQFVLSLTPYDAVTVYTEAVEKISKLYSDRDRASVEKLFATGLDELDRALGDATFRQTFLPDTADQKVAKFRQTVRDGWRAKLPVNVREATHAAREVVSAATRQLGLSNGSVVVLELLCGACSGLDEYSSYVVPTRPGIDPTDPVIELTAYGLITQFEPKGVLCVAIVPGSWAALHTKLHKGDRVVRVNGKEMANATPARLLDALRAAGPNAHELELAPASDEMPGTVVRLPNPLPTVFGIDMLSDKDAIGYLRLAAFQDQTPRELDDAVLELKARGAKVLVIDLRGNPGGLFTSAVASTRQFLPTGLIVTTQGQAPDFANRVFTSDAGMTAYDLPVVLLIDTRTMSSAEIFAAGLKENQRATLVGVATFGKGLVQAPVRLQSFDTPDDGPQPTSNKAGILVVSVAAVFSPSGAALNGIGVTPHVIEPNAERQLSVAIQKAIELLNGRPMPMVMR